MGRERQLPGVQGGLEDPEGPYGVPQGLITERKRKGLRNQGAEARPLELREGEAEKGVKPTSDPGDGRREGPGIYSLMREEEEVQMEEEGGIPSQDRILHFPRPLGERKEILVPVVIRFPPDAIPEHLASALGLPKVPRVDTAWFASSWPVQYVLCPLPDLPEGLRYALYRGSGGMGSPLPQEKGEYPGL